MDELEIKTMQPINLSKTNNNIFSKPAGTDPMPRRQRERLKSISQDPPGTSNKAKRWNLKELLFSEHADPQSIIKIRSAHCDTQSKRTKPLSNNRIRINVCGDRYETHRTTLDAFPNTLLGNEKQLSLYYDETHKEYFFDRHRSSFGAILYYYQSRGRLRRPDYVPLEVFLEEVLFFQLGPDAFHQIREEENITVVTKIRLPINPIRRFLWAITEYPHYSKIAKIVHIISLIMVITLTVVLSLETLPQYDTAYCTEDEVANPTIMLNETNQNSSSDSEICGSYFKSPFFLLQSVCISFFTIEFIIRILCTPSFLEFIKSFMNWTDLIAIIPFYITIVIYLTGNDHKIDMDTYASLRFLRIIRLLQVLKFGRTFKNVKSLRVFLVTTKESVFDFVLMVTIITAIGFIFGASAYYAENDSNGQAFDSIFTATYWGIITITALGYGDITPKTIVGRIISCLCALFGAATMSMLTSILVGRYRHIYVRTVFIDEDVLEIYKHPIIEDDHENFKDENILIELNEISNVENSDVKTDENAIDQTNTLQVPSILDSKSLREDSIKPSNNSMYFIIGHIKNGKNGISNVLLEKINDIIEKRQTSSIHISFSIAYDKKKYKNSSFDVRFQLESSSDEDLTTVLAEDNDDGNSLMEILKGGTNRRSVLKTFQRVTSAK